MSGKIGDNVYRASGVVAAATAAGGADITTEGNAFANYNSINANVTTTTASTKNMFLMGAITVASGYTWTVEGGGTLTILGA